MFYYYQTIEKVNSYKERKNNSYNTETLLLSDCKMKLMKNEAAYQMLRKTGLVVRATEKKKPTSTNVVTLIDP